jgi:hypothetical protein
VTEHVEAGPSVLGPPAASVGAEPEPRGRVVGWLRRLGEKLLLVALGLVVFAVVMLLRLRGDVHEAMAPVGPQLSSTGMLQALLDRDEPESAEDRVLVINGQRLHLNAEVVDEPVAQALDTALADCPTLDEIGGPVSAGDRGYGLCMHTTDRDGNSLSLTERLESFRETLDFADLGRLEYIYAEEREGGRTALLRLESGEVLDLDNLLPVEGDASGTDPDGIPRPPDGRRVLHAYEDGMPYFVTVYGRSERTVAELQTWYRANVNHDLWREIDTATQAEERGIDLTGVDMMVFVPVADPTRFALVGFEARPGSETQREGSTVSIVEAG